MASDPSWWQWPLTEWPSMTTWPNDWGRNEGQWCAACNMVEIVWGGGAMEEGYYTYDMTILIVNSEKLIQCRYNDPSDNITVAFGICCYPLPPILGGPGYSIVVPSRPHLPEVSQWWLSCADDYLLSVTMVYITAIILFSQTDVCVIFNGGLFWWGWR